MVMDYFFLQIKSLQQSILVPIDQVHSVLPIMQLQQVPSPYPYLAGFLNYHGEPFAIYHLSELIQSTRAIYDLKTPIVLSQLSLGTLGFLVSDVLNVICLSAEDIHHDPNHTTLPFVSGFVEKEQESAWILDLEQLLQFHSNELTYEHEQAK